VRKKKRKCKLYFSSKKALERSSMRMANKECNFRGPSKLLDFGSTDIVDIIGISDGVLWAVQEVEVMRISDVNEVKCATQMNVCPTPPVRYHFVCDTNANPRV
jgi:hypothetical protein